VKLQKRHSRFPTSLGKISYQINALLYWPKLTLAGLSFIDDSHWQSQHDLSVELYATSAVALYSCTNGNQILLEERMNAVFNHATSLEEEFRTRYNWINLLAMTSMQHAIDECHKLLTRLGEPIDSSIHDPSFVSSELARVKDAFLAQGNHFAASRMRDGNEVKAMKVMTSLAVYYHYQRSVVGGIVCARMVQLTMRYGYCDGVCWDLTVVSKLSHNMHSHSLSHTLLRKCFRPSICCILSC
jgi:hypothetical protein